MIQYYKLKKQQQKRHITHTHTNRRNHYPSMFVNTHIHTSENAAQYFFAVKFFSMSLLLSEETVI